MIVMIILTQYKSVKKKTCHFCPPWQSPGQNLHPRRQENLLITFNFFASVIVPICLVKRGLWDNPNNQDQDQPGDLVWMALLHVWWWEIELITIFDNWLSLMINDDNWWWLMINENNWWLPIWRISIEGVAGWLMVGNWW